MEAEFQCIQVWPPVGLKIETLSYLAPLTHESLAKDVDYLIHNGWVPCLEFELEVLRELEVDKKAYPNAFIRIIGFDNKRQVQCVSFIAYKPPGN
ncbi:Ribulose bisphosphate carboxylase small chain [Quillaja saponaria]|uniref:Ribulose bisphosphate carboxylase small subunit n=1 Tax=Quillaja saponaria TaxID=32244 RepID=A0AAD7KNL7_QUISA|nr:Ribulose bisphosphate carboxylase small chain [Quillaja saponaria]